MFRSVLLVLLVVAAGMVALANAALAARPFPESGYSINDDQFLAYFDHRGGAQVLGNPVSREFDLLGSRVQLLQRAVLQLRPDGSVGILDVLDNSFLAAPELDGSVFPMPDPSAIQGAPTPSDPEYALKMVDFMRSRAPDEWGGLKPNFFSTFMNTVGYSDAFPFLDGDPALMPLINLEIWGMPTSQPAYDPDSPNLVYLRFQRGIMQFDKSTGVTRGFPIGEFLKALITGQGLTPNQERLAKGNRLYRQYDNRWTGGLARPWELGGGTNLFSAFERDGIVLSTPLNSAPTPTPTATPSPTATPAPPTLTPTPAPPTPSAAPENIVVAGSPWFTDQTNEALRLLASRAPIQYATIKKYVYSIEESTGVPSYSFPYRTLRPNEAAAFAPGWRSYQNNQVQWYASLLAHNATHLEQADRGVPTTGRDAELEALYQQLNVLRSVDSSPNAQLFEYVRSAINTVQSGGSSPMGDWGEPWSPA